MIIYLHLPQRLPFCCFTSAICKVRLQKLHQFTLQLSSVLKPPCVQKQTYPAVLQFDLRSTAIQIANSDYVGRQIKSLGLGENSIN